MNKAVYIKASGYIFSLVALLHGLRLVFGWGVQIGDWVVPLWLSIFGVIIAGYLAYWSLKLK